MTYRVTAPPRRLAVRLTNGMRLVHRHQRFAPLVAVDLWVRAGARYERPGEEGVAHFLEHMLFRGTSNRPGAGSDVAIEDLGGTLEAGTGPDLMHVYTVVRPEALGPTLSVLADLARSATLPESAIEAERRIILDELASHESDASAAVTDALYASAWGGHPYGRSPAGSPAAIRAIVVGTIRTWYERMFRPDRCVLSIAGDCEPDAAVAKATDAFGDWRATARLDDPADIPGLPDAREVVQTGPVSQSVVGTSWPAPAAVDADMATIARVAVELLELPGGRLSTAVPLPVSSAVHYTPRLDMSLLFVTSVTSGEPVNRITPAVCAAAEGLASTPFGAGEVAAARDRAAGRLGFDTETAAGLAREEGYTESVNGLATAETLRRLRLVSESDIRQFARRFLSPDHRVTVALLPAAPAVHS